MTRPLLFPSRKQDCESLGLFPLQSFPDSRFHPPFFLFLVRLLFVVPGVSPKQFVSSLLRETRAVGVLASAFSFFPLGCFPPAPPLRFIASSAKNIQTAIQPWNRWLFLFDATLEVLSDSFPLFLFNESLPDRPFPPRSTVFRLLFSLGVDESSRCFSLFRITRFCNDSSLFS